MAPPVPILLPDPTPPPPPPSLLHLLGFFCVRESICSFTLCKTSKLCSCFSVCHLIPPFLSFLWHWNQCPVLNCYVLFLDMLLLFSIFSCKYFFIFKVLLLVFSFFKPDTFVLFVLLIVIYCCAENSCVVTWSVEVMYRVQYVCMELSVFVLAQPCNVNKKEITSRNKRMMEIFLFLSM